MKKLWLVVGLAALTGWAVNSYADVQNIRLSGDIRIRGYYLANVDVGGESPTGNNSGTGFIEQRTRVSVEADLEDHVLVVVTLKAEGLWGAGNQTSGTTGPGTSDSSTGEGAIARSWDLGVSEAYVQFSEVFYSPLTVKLGRQYLNYGHGLILSSAEQEYNFDAGRAILDYYPLTIDILGARLADKGSFDASHFRPASDLVFANVRYEMTDSVLKDLELYAGWVAQSHQGQPLEVNNIPPSFNNGESPWIVGLRGDAAVGDLSLWAEGAYEGGSSGPGGSQDSISAIVGNVGAKFVMKDVQMAPSFNANYIYASGGGQDGSGQFRPWFDFAEGYNGYLFAPALSNIHIFNLGASVKPCENTTFSLEGYYYLKADKNSPAGGNGNVDFGGIEWAEFGTTPAQSRELGWELDSILAYDYSKDVRTTLVYAVFIPEGAYHNGIVSQTAMEVRAEVNVRF